MKAVMLDFSGNVKDKVEFEEFTNYKIIKISDIYYVWISDYLGPTHCDIADQYSNSDFSKIECAGSFTFKNDNRIYVRSSDRYSMSLRGTEANSRLCDDDIKEFAAIVGVEPFDDFLEEKIV